MCPTVSARESRQTTARGTNTILKTTTLRSLTQAPSQESRRKSQGAPASQRSSKKALKPNWADIQASTLWANYWYAANAERLTADAHGLPRAREKSYGDALTDLTTAKNTATTHRALRKACCKTPLWEPSCRRQSKILRCWKHWKSISGWGLQTKSPRTKPSTFKSELPKSTLSFKKCSKRYPPTMQTASMRNASPSWWTKSKGWPYSSNSMQPCGKREKAQNPDSMRFSPYLTDCKITRWNMTIRSSGRLLNA